MKRNFDSSLAVSCMLLFMLVTQIIVPIGCANQVPPLGGPRDSIPPTLMTVRPLDSATDFNSKKIVFEFNEYVQVDNPSQNLLVSPTPKQFPEVTHKLKTITVTIKDTLEPNTTYSYNFGNAIKDINEGNVLQNFTYIFTTGKTLDSFQLSGRVILAETGKTDSTLIAVLYQSGDDSAIVKKDPRYIARLDRDGNYQFRHLPAGTFYLYTFPGEGGQKRYGGEKKLFAFANLPVEIGKTSVADTLYAYAEKDIPKPPTTAGRGQGAKNTQADKRLRIETSLQGGEQDLLSPFEVYFRSGPIKYFDSTKIRFTDEKFNTIPTYSFKQDTSNKKITLIHEFSPGASYAIIVDKEFAQDTAGRKLLTNDTLLFKSRNLSSYGSIRWRFPKLDLAKNPVLLLVQGEDIKFKHTFSNNEFVAKLFVPGDYELRILYDDNKNGVWDPGQFFGKKKQPEKVVQVPRKITVKANWDNESDFAL